MVHDEQAKEGLNLIHPYVYDSVFIVLSHPHGVIFPGYIESLLEFFNFGGNFLVFISFDCSIALLGLISTGSEK